MDATGSRYENETSALLATGARATSVRDGLSAETDSAAVQVLPVALFAALAMACTAATSFFAYASLLCQDLRSCKGEESSKFADLVAITTGGANIVGISAFGVLQQLAINNRKRGLLVWIVCRSMSVVMLLLGSKILLHNV